MSEYTARFSETHAVVAKIDPGDYATAQETARWFAGNYRRYVAVVQYETIGGGETLTCKFREHTAASGGTSQDVSGKTTTALDANDSKHVAMVELRTEEMDLADQFDYLSFVMTPNASIDCSCIVFGFDARFEPVSTANVDEIID